MSRISNPRPTKIPSKNAWLKETGFTVLAKIIFLIVLWTVCFSHPFAKHVNDAGFVDHLLSNSTIVKGSK